MFQEKSTFDKLSDKLDEAILILKGKFQPYIENEVDEEYEDDEIDGADRADEDDNPNKADDEVGRNDYHLFFTTITDYISVLFINGKDINDTNSEGENFLLYFFRNFFNNGNMVYNCKVYNPVTIMIFKHLLFLGANPFHVSYVEDPDYDDIYYEESVFTEIFSTMTYLFNKRLYHQDDDGDSFLTYDITSLIPFRYQVPDDPYPEYNVQDFNNFYLMKFRYFLEMLYMVIDVMHPSLYDKHENFIVYYDNFVKNYFIRVYPLEEQNALRLIVYWNNMKKRNFWIFLILSGFIYSTDNECINEHIIKRKMSIRNNALITVFDLSDIVKNICDFL